MYLHILVFAGVIFNIGATPNSTLDCSSSCPNTEAIVAPHCEHTTRIEPEYDACGCLKDYRCCPTVCPNLLHDCKKGFEIPVNVTDCCGCRAIRCDPCPKTPTPLCSPGCQVRVTLSDVTNGCHFDSCKTVCPQMDEMVCPSCREAVSFKNESYCKCAQQKCVRKTCPPKIELPSKDCALRKWAKNECGCEKQFYDTANYCDRHNADAAAKTCADKCFKNVVRGGKGPCGCDKAECVRINEDCKQVFTGWSCPSGSLKVMGTTPCGLDREMCVKCDDDNLEASSCDLDCNRIVQDKDVNGCPLKRCVREGCPPIPPLPNNCLAFKSFNISVNKCGCVSWDVGFCIDGDVAREGMTWYLTDGNFYSLHSQLVTWPEARDFCLARKSRLAIIETRQEEAAIRKLVKTSQHWIGARCLKNSTGSFYFWETADGYRIPFDFASVPSSGRTGTFRSCDTSRDGIAVNTNGFDDIDHRYKKAFICEMP